MALIHCNFFSKTLGMATSMDVILPQFGVDKRPEGKLKTLYLFHGLSDDHTIWQRRTSIERYVSPLGLAVVMPSVHRSFYTDMARGQRYWSFISQELPDIACSFFPLSEAREDNFVAGLSMGGYGAFKLAFKCPTRFVAAASLSGVMDVANFSDSRAEEFMNIFGDLEKLKGSENDLFHLAEGLSNFNGPKPYLYQCCGREDYLYSDNLRFVEYARGLSLDITFEEEAGTHEWGYWDMKIQHVLKWLTSLGCLL